MRTLEPIEMNDSLESADRALRRSAEPLIEAIRRSPDGRREFFDLTDFPWAADVECAWPEMRTELDRLLKALDMLPGFEEIQAEQVLLTQDRRWKVFPFFLYGQWIPRNEHRCPATARALRRIPGLAGAMFSVLQPGKELDAHTGNYAGVLRYHLGLKVPEPARCGIRVGTSTRHWHEGESMVFDDTHLHSAWNRGTQDRVVLFVDFERPLPTPLDRLNRRILDAIGDSDFIGHASERWDEWEQRHGDALDRLLVEASA